MDLGRIFHFVLPDGRSKGECRPFMIVREWSPGMVNGLVFLDGVNDYLDDGGNPVKEPPAGNAWAESTTVAWLTSVGRSKGATGRTWHRWEDCPKGKPDELPPLGPSFINLRVDVTNGNPEMTHVVNLPELQIPWPVGLTMAQAIKEWAGPNRTTL